MGETFRDSFKEVMVIKDKRKIGKVDKIKDSMDLIYNVHIVKDQDTQ